MIQLMKGRVYLKMFSNAGLIKIQGVGGGGWAKGHDELEIFNNLRAFF